MMSLARLAVHCYPSLAVIPPACSLSFCEQVPRGRIDVDFTNNLLQIAGKLAADLRGEDEGGRKGSDVHVCVSVRGGE